jgi:putative FmdB family regulatory protein
MPTYSYICNSCKKSFEKFFLISQYDSQPKCEHCNSSKTERDYKTDLGSMTGSVIKSDDELKTIGDLANRNRDRMSNDHKKTLEYQHNKYKETPSTKQLPKGMSRIQRPSYKVKWR